jgi:Tol biopolymer transport system component
VTQWTSEGRDPESAHDSLERDIQALIGRRIGAYEIVRFVARGGMGMVFAGRDTRLDRPVAIKALTPAFSEGSSRRTRLLREARHLASLSHPNVATIYGLEVTEDAEFLIMELVEGTSLATRLANGPLPIPEVLALGIQIAAGVEAAHAASVIHRDLKPGNVIITPDGKAKVLDFGLAREVQPVTSTGSAAGVEPLAPTLTDERVLLGTPRYMSPEQARGSSIDHRTDIFSFGCILYECLTGIPAFPGDTLPDIFVALLGQEPSWDALPAATPLELQRLLQRCLAKDVAQRSRDIGDVRLELEEILRRSEWERSAARDARRDAPATTPARSARMRQALLAGGAVLVAGAVIVALIAWRAATAPVTATPPGPALPPASAKRFALPFPGDQPQSDLPRLRLSLSLDGRRLVFLAKDRDGVPGLWLRTFGDLSTTRLLSTTQDWAPLLSPDGEWVSYLSGGAMWKRRVGGGEALKIADIAWWGGAAWGTDGTIAFTPDWAQPLGRVSETGGTPQPITSLRHGQGEFAHVTPSITRDNRSVLYCVWNGKEDTRIDRVTLAGGEQITVVNDGCNPRVAHTPQGAYLLWERKGTIFAARFDEPSGTLSGPEHAVVDGVLTDGAQFASFFDVSDDGTLAYIPGPVFYEESQLFWLDESGKASAFSADVRAFGEPHVSADGTKISVLIKRKVYGAYVMDLRRGTFDRVIFDSDVTSGALSPSGDSFVYSGNRGGRYSIWLRSLRDGKDQLLLPPQGNYGTQMVWSADGKHIAFSMSADEHSKRDIWVVTPGSGAQARRFVDGPGEEKYPRFSPNGKWMAYVSDEGGAPVVYLRSFPDGLVQRQISMDGASEPNWSPDGTKLYYRSSDALYMAPVSPEDGQITGPATVVYHERFGQSDEDLLDYAVAPDGRLLLVAPSEKPTSVQHIVVLLNWERGIQ